MGAIGAGFVPPFFGLGVWAMKSTVSLTVNGKNHAITTDPERPLLDVLREELGLTGTKYGCGEGRCGSCTVLMEGRRVHACQVRVADAGAKAITTIEGLAKDGT
jgi:aerobic-type carbon monoxide dehydrogenase small subunit (CoxS/CutS family)